MLSLVPNLPLSEITRRPAVDVTGADALYTSVDDWMKWDNNLLDPVIGTRELFAVMHRSGKLDNGAEVPYGWGFSLGEFDGYAISEHGGYSAGYRSQYLRFSDEQVSVVIFANTDSLYPRNLARKITRFYFAHNV